MITRRTMLASTVGAAAIPGLSTGLAGIGGGVRPSATTIGVEGADDVPRILMACKYGMTGGVEGSMTDRFGVLKDLGFHGVEMDSPATYTAAEVREASEATGLPVHGVVNSKHWQVRMSSPDGNVRTDAIGIMDRAIRDAHAFGGSSVLLVPGVVGQEASQEEVWTRSIEGIRAVLPTAARLGIHILIENVWNGFCYVHNGPSDQTADELARYLDEIDSPWVGSYFDIGNHQKYGKPQSWIRTLGRRIVKLDVKGWGIEAGFSKIGEGDVDWAEVRAALDEVRFTGWATAEVGGGNRDRLKEIRENMHKALGF